MTGPSDRVVSSTELDGWCARWYLGDSDRVHVIGITTPNGREVALPHEYVPIAHALDYMPESLRDQIEKEKFKDDPRINKWSEGIRRSYRRQGLID